MISSFDIGLLSPVDQFFEIAFPLKLAQLALLYIVTYHLLQFISIAASVDLATRLYDGKELGISSLTESLRKLVKKCPLITFLYSVLLSTSTLFGGNCQKLLMVDFGNNNLSGVIPPQLLSITSLSIYLRLAKNKFSGSIPTEVGRLTSLGSIDMSHNILSGNIPSSMGSCLSLESLQLQGNLLQGAIPESFSSLRGLQALDLSSNNLTGPVPKFMDLMNISQSNLHLSYNNFDDEVDDDQGFFISVTGNNKLCGGMAELKLPPCHFSKQSKQTFNLKWKIGISTISGVVFLALMTSCLFIHCKRGIQVSVSVNDLQLPLPYQWLYKATNGFSSTNLIGVGSFGSVYKGVLINENGTETNIAVKVFNLERYGAFKSFKAECEALKNIKHRNLMRIITVCSSVDHSGKDFKALIYEFLANGSLEEWLHHSIERVREPTRSLIFNERVNLAIDIAYGVDYLHNNCGTTIVHCDLKPSNILLDEDMVAHIGDFGLARILSEHADPSSNSIFIKGTVGYAAPEYGMGNKVSLQGDVYSYGILLLEMFTGRRPVDETFEEDFNLHNIIQSALSKQQTMEVVDPILLGRPTTHCRQPSSRKEETIKRLEELLTSILEIGITCSSDNPEKRVSMSEVLSKLTTIKKQAEGGDWRNCFCGFESNALISVE